MNSNEVLKNYYNCLVSKGGHNFNIENFRPPNTLDFILEDDYEKDIRALVTYLNAANRIEVTLRDMNGHMILCVDFYSEILDFTIGKKPLKHSLITSPLSAGQKDTSEIIEKIYKEVDRHKEGILKEFKPSKELSKIVGHRTLYKYQVLNMLSKHIMKNHLFKGGNIKIDSVLSEIFGKNTLFVNESAFFSTVKRHLTLVK